MSTSPPPPILLNCYTVGSTERTLWKLETTEGIIFIHDNLLKKALSEVGLDLPVVEQKKTLQGLALKNTIYRHRAGDLIPESKAEHFKTDGFHILTPLQFNPDSITGINDFDYHQYMSVSSSGNLTSLVLVYKNQETDPYYWISTMEGSFSVSEVWFNNFLKPLNITPVSHISKLKLFINLLVVNEIIPHEPGDPIPDSPNQKFRKKGHHIRGFLQLVGELNWKKYEYFEELAKLDT